MANQYIYYSLLPKQLGAPTTAILDGDEYYNQVSRQAYIYDISTTSFNLRSVRQLSTVTGINAKSVATTALYTVPSLGTNQNCIVTMAIVRCTAATAITSGPTIGIGVTAGSADIYAQTALSTLTSNTKAYNYAAPGVLVLVAPGSTINLGVSVAATGTSMTVACDLWGYFG